jgi:hypothetical protein
MALFDDTRSDWGAVAPANHLSAVAASRRTEFYNHYDGGSDLGLADEEHSACLVKVKQDQKFHMGPQRGWSDIGYNGLICQHGRAIEGRGIDYVGAHCPDHNTSAYGFQFMVGGDESPTPAAYARMRRLYDDCVERSGHPLAKRGHRDGNATTCPGDLIYAWLEAGMTASEEDFLSALTDEQQRNLYNRVMGGIPAGSAVGRVDAAGKPARLLDTGDGGYLLAKIQASASDPAAIAAAIPADIAQQVANELAKRLNSPEVS